MPDSYFRNGSFTCRFGMLGSRSVLGRGGQFLPLYGNEHHEQDAYGPSRLTLPS